MGLGILEPKADRVPGTVTIYEREARERAHQANASSTPLKYGIGRNGEPIVLVPQPSDDPNDPLNWPLWRRDFILGVLCLLAVIATTLSPILAADSLTFLYDFDIGFTQVALLTGYHLMGVAVAGVFFIPSARIWGKRHLYLLGCIILIFSSAWGGASKNSYHSLLGSRIVQGFGLAPFEALVSASVGDMYHVHQRGKRMAIATVALFGSAFLTPVIVGVIANNLGWWWSFNFVAIFSAAMLPVVFFFVPETAYVRDPALELDFEGATFANRAVQTTENEPQPGAEYYAVEGQKPAGVETAEISKTEETNASPSGGSFDVQQPPSGSHRNGIPQKTPYLRTLLPFNGRKSNEPFLKLFLRPFPLFLQPGVLWACFTQGAMIGWTVLIGVVLAALLLSPPLYFTQVQVGYMYSSAFLGAVIGLAICGLIADPSARWLTKRNGGTYEPEFRMVLVIPQWIFAAIGLYGFGISMSDLDKYGWIVPEVFFGFVIAGMVCGAVASALYLVDAHRELAIECFTCLIIFKNIFSFALTFKSYDWIIGLSPKTSFVIIASVQMGLCALTPFMYVFGKYNRWFWAKYDMFAILRLN